MTSLSPLIEVSGVIQDFNKLHFIARSRKPQIHHFPFYRQSARGRTHKRAMRNGKYKYNFVIN